MEIITQEEKIYFGFLNEYDKRLYAGMLAKRLGHGGIQKVSKSLGLHANTVSQGKKDFLNHTVTAVKGQRKTGGGKKKLDLQPDWLLTFEKLLNYSTAGLPQDKDVKWTYLSQTQIVNQLAEKGLKISRHHVVQLLKLGGYKKRNALKKNTLKEVEGRNEQFEKIATYRTSFAAQGLPIISIDTKKKELLGDFSRSGQCYATAERRTKDHDFLSAADGQIVPHGIYDVSDNTGYITLGTSKDTSEFVCDNLRDCWINHLQYKYPEAQTILLLCDGGGSNASAHYIVKQDLVKLAKTLKINILVAHYPPYCSKWNPIEHRVFSQITHTWSGTPLLNIEFVQKITNETTTKTGLKIITTINKQNYQTKRAVEQEFKQNLDKFITFDDKRPKWNYLININ